jgi:hypothetical protein
MFLIRIGGDLGNLRKIFTPHILEIPIIAPKIEPVEPKDAAS